MIKYSEGDVISIKISGGNEVIGKCVDPLLSVSEFLTLKDPILLIPQKTPQGITVALGDMTEGGNYENEVDFLRKNILFVRKLSISGELYRTYVGAISGILIPGPGSRSPLHLVK